MVSSLISRKGKKDEEHTDEGSRDAFFDALHTDQNTLMAANFKENARKNSERALLKQSNTENRDLFIRQMVNSTLKKPSGTSQYLTHNGKYLRHSDAMEALDAQKEELQAKNNEIREKIDSIKGDIRSLQGIPLLGISAAAAYPRIIKKMRKEITLNDKALDKINEAHGNIKHHRISSLDQLPKCVRICIGDRCAFVNKSELTRQEANKCRRDFTKVTVATLSLTRDFAASLGADHNYVTVKTSASNRTPKKAAEPLYENHPN